MIDLGRSAAVRPITCQIGSTVFDHAPSSNRLRNSRPVRSVAFTPGFNIDSTSMIAASLMACARRMHSTSSGVFTILAAPTTPLASTSSRSPRAARSGMVRSSTAIRPAGSDSARARASSSHSRSSPGWTCARSNVGGTPSGNGVNTSGGAPSAVTTATRALWAARRGIGRGDDHAGGVSHRGSARPRAARRRPVRASARPDVRDARGACAPCRAGCRISCSSRESAYASWDELRPPRRCNVGDFLEPDFSSVLRRAPCTARTVATS